MGNAINSEADPSHIIDFESIAASVYRVYELNIGTPTPIPFDDLEDEERLAWEAAARHAANLTNWNILTLSPGQGDRSVDASRLDELEQQWKGWKPEE